MATRKGLHKIILEVDPGDGQIQAFTVCKDICKGDAHICLEALQANAAPGHTYRIE